MPMIDIQEVGTGGGSIARVEVGNALRVGPESAGAAPGPVVLRARRHRADHHRRQSRARPARRRPLPRRRDAARHRGRARRRSTEKIAKPLGLDPVEAAEGILRIATTKMAHVVRWVTTERGLDAANFALVAYGGAGPLHAASVARELQIAHRHHPARARAFLRLRHAGRRSAPRFRQHLVHAARRRLVRRRWRRSSPRWRRAAARPSRAGRRVAGTVGDARRRHALCRPGARRHGRPAGRAVQEPGPRRHQAALRRGAPDPLRLFGRDTRRPRSSACAAPSSARCESRRSSISPRARPSRTPRRSAARGRSISPAPASSTRRPIHRAAAQGRQPDRRPGADRGACVDHGGASGRHGRGRRLRRSRHRDQEELSMDAVDRAQRKPKPPSATTRWSPKSCATASSP